MITITPFHCRPTKSPSTCSSFPGGINGAEVDINFVCFGHYDRRIRIAAAVTHQGRPVPICNSDKVVKACTASISRIDSKDIEFKPYYLSLLHGNVCRQVEVLRIILRKFWWCYHTWGISHIFSGKQLSKNYTYQPKPLQIPSVPHPSSGQKGKFIGCQSPDPVIESCSPQVNSVGHRPK